LQIDPQAADDGTGDLSNEKLWHQQQLASGVEHTPLGAAAAATDDAAVKVRWRVEVPYATVYSRCKLTAPVL
jgi:hypothetical protein